jgi:hypothetical protein
MMFCKFCGREIAEKLTPVEFCPFCGKRLTEVGHFTAEMSYGVEHSRYLGLAAYGRSSRTKQILAIVGALLLFVGVFLPIVSVPIVGSVNYFHNGQGDGTIVLVLAVISIILAVTRRFRGLWVTGLCSVGLLLFTLVNFLMRMSELREQMQRQLADNPFRGLFDVAMNSVQVQWGWAVLMLGGGLIVASAAMRSPEALNVQRAAGEGATAKWWAGATVAIFLLLLELASLLNTQRRVEQNPSLVQRVPSIPSAAATTSSTVDSHALMLQQAAGLESAEPSIRQFCGKEWANDFHMQAFCVAQQREAVAVLEQGKPVDIDEAHFITVRTTCASDWPEDFRMRAHCEREQYSALRQLNGNAEGVNPQNPEQPNQSPPMNPIPSPAKEAPAPETQTGESQTSFSAYVAKLRSVVVRRGFQPIGNTWLVDADSQGNKLLIQQATCNEVPDGHCQKLFIALEDRFLGTDTYLPSWSVHNVAQERVGSFSAVYEDFSDPDRKPPVIKVIYTWDGQKLTASGTAPTRTSTP